MRESGPGLRLLLDPPLAHAQLALSGQQSSSQPCTGAKDDADETQEVSRQLTDASQGVPEVPEQVDDSIHAPLIADEACNDNLP